MMLPRAARLWATLVAYGVLLAAIYFGQSARSLVAQHPPGIGGGLAGGEEP